MALISKTFIVDVVPGKTPPTVHVSERDVGRAYYVTLSDDGSQFRIPTGTTAKVEGTIGPYGFSENANVINDTVIFILSSKMTAIKGKVWTKIKLTHDADTISTCAFWLNVDKAGSIEGEYIDPPVGPDSGGDEGGGITLDGLVQYNVAQNLTDAEKAQARTNIGAVAAASGKGLSTNDYTAAEKDKLSGIEEGAEKNVQADWNQTDENAKDFIKNKPSLKSDSYYSKVFTLSLSSNNIGIYSAQDSTTKLYRDDIFELFSNHEIPMLGNPATGEIYYFYKQPSIAEAFSNTGELVFICVTDDSIKKLVVKEDSYEHSVISISGGNGNHFKIVATYNSASQSYTFDKTASEIVAAVSAGQVPVVTIAATGTGGQFTNNQWMYAESSFDGEDTYIKFYSLRQNGDVEYMMYVDSEQSAYTYTYQALPPATAANNGKIPKIVNGRWALSELESDIAYISIQDDGSMVYNGNSINCEDVVALARSGKAVIGLFDFYADGSFIYPLYLTLNDEQGSVEFTGFFWEANNTWSICSAYCSQGDVLSMTYIPVTDYTKMVNLNNDGSIRSTDPSTIYYNEVKNFLDKKIPVCLLVNQDGTRTRIYSTEQMSSSTNAPIVFAGPIRHANGDITEAVFLLDSSNNLTVSYTARENALHKVTNLSNYYASEIYYPSVKGVWDTFQRKPVTVWEVQDATQGLSALNTNITANLAWQLTDLDLTPFKRIKIYSRAGRKTGAIAADSSITPASIIEMSLDDRAKETVSQNVFIGSSVVQNPNDANRLGLLTCAVSADKTKFAVVRATTLYGTAATSNTDAHPNVFMIEGYYD